MRKMERRERARKKRRSEEKKKQGPAWEMMLKPWLTDDEAVKYNASWKSSLNTSLPSQVMFGGYIFYHIHLSFFVRLSYILDL